MLFAVSAFLKKGLSEPGKAPSRPSFLEKVKGVQKFSSEEEFKAYLTEGEAGGLSLFGRGLSGEQLGLPVFEGAPLTGITLAPPAGFVSPKREVPSRISQTNVQVVGIDEPDIVKLVIIPYPFFLYKNILLIFQAKLSTVLMSQTLPPLKKNGNLSLRKTIPWFRLGYIRIKSTWLPALKSIRKNPAL